MQRNRGRLFAPSGKLSQWNSVPISFIVAFILSAANLALESRTLSIVIFVFLLLGIAQIKKESKKRG